MKLPLDDIKIKYHKQNDIIRNTLLGRNVSASFLPDIFRNPKLTICEEGDDNDIYSLELE